MSTLDDHLRNIPNHSHCDLQMTTERTVNVERRNHLRFRQSHSVPPWIAVGRIKPTPREERTWRTRRRDVATTRDGSRDKRHALFERRTPLRSMATGVISQTRARTRPNRGTIEEPPVPRTMKERNEQLARLAYGIIERATRAYGISPPSWPSYWTEWAVLARWVNREPMRWLLDKYSRDE